MKHKINEKNKGKEVDNFSTIDKLESTSNSSESAGKARVTHFE
jgi:hypothetical protein